MDFNENKPIYKQIVDLCYARIISDVWHTDGRVPSIKELSVELAVNNRTVLKAFEELQSQGIIYPKRGLGYYVSADAPGLILEARRAEFFRDIIPDLRERMRLLGITLADIAPHLQQQLQSPDIK